MTVLTTILTQSSQTPQNRLNDIAGKSQYVTEGTLSAQTIIINVVIYALGFLGAYFLILIIISGIQWLTSGGNEDKISHAQDRVKNAAIGFAVVLTAYALVTLAIKIFSQAV